jgi:hypothetical protein
VNGLVSLDGYKSRLSGQEPLPGLRALGVVDRLDLEAAQRAAVVSLQGERRRIGQEAVVGVDIEGELQFSARYPLYDPLFADDAFDYRLCCRTHHTTPPLHDTDQECGAPQGHEPSP